MASTDQLIVALIDLQDEIKRIARDNPTNTSGEFTSWYSRVRSVLTEALTSTHHITQSFITLRWRPNAAVYASGSSARASLTRPTFFRQAADQARGLLEAAAVELDTKSIASSLYDDNGIDAELWEFIASDVDAEHWGKAATQATLFLEDRIRRWCGQPLELVGERLMGAVFGQNGNYRLGRTDGEKDGWNLFAIGIAKALRNAAAHRIDTRPDHRRYVLGLIGSCSLLLTQLRYEHGNRFVDLSPATSGPIDPAAPETA
jgi:Protein of unknown function (Hypoth_ymh)